VSPPRSDLRLLAIDDADTRVCVHRGTQQIGGSCIEIMHPDGARLILDPGRPLDAPEGATGLLPASLGSGSSACLQVI
jgi:hypothetical protein